MVIGTCGFIGTGSSAVSDYIKEFSTVSALDMFEFVITHGPDGLEDLDYQLNEHCVKYTSSAVAIERFRSNIYNYLIRYQKDDKIKKNIEVILEKFISQITQVCWRGFGAADNQLYGAVMYRHPKLNMFPQKIGQKISKVVTNKTGKTPTRFPAHDINFSIKPEKFDESAQQFITSVFEVCGLDTNKKILLDQPFSAINPHRSFKFFDDPKAIIVDRDPCDMYLLAKRYFHPKALAYCIPTDTAEHFIVYYEAMRKLMYKNVENNHKDVIVIQFEDMVYRYEETRRKINDFCGLNDSDRVGHYFEPSMSVANTQLHKRFPDEEENLCIIRERLQHYLYDFNQYGDVDTSGKMFPNRSPLNQE